MSEALEVANLRIEMGGRALLDDISLSLRPGECLALVGPNGAGKSTLLRAILGLVAPARGEIRWSGESIRKIPGRRRAGILAWLPQRGLVEEAIPVLEFVKAARFRFAESHHDSRRAAREALETLGAADLAERTLPTLSGGELQRVMMATLVAQDADFFLLDEPANHLDPAQQTAFYAMLANQWQNGRGVVCVTHDINLLTRLARAGEEAAVRVVGLAEGKLAFSLSLDAPGLKDALEELFALSLETITRDGHRYFLPGVRA